MSQMNNYGPIVGGVKAKLPQGVQTSPYPYQTNSTKSKLIAERKNMSIAQIFQQKGLKYNGPSKMQPVQSNAQKIKNIMDKNGVILHTKSQLKGGALTTSANTAQNSPKVFNKNKNSMYHKNQITLATESRKQVTHQQRLDRESKSQVEYEN